MCLRHERFPYGRARIVFLVPSGRYFPLFEFPSLDSETSPILRDDIKGACARLTLITNCAARLQPDRIVLAGLNPTQSTIFAHLPSHRVITVQSQDELRAALAFLSPVHEGILRCAPSDLAHGLVRAARSGRRVVCDPAAQPLPRAARTAAQGIIVAERTDDLSDIIAANYAIAIGADFELVESFDYRESGRINRLLIEWGETRSVSARSALVNEARTRLTAIDFGRYLYATFFTRGLPYGFVLENLIPTSHVLSGVRDDHFVFNNILLERSKSFFGSAAVFSPGVFEHEETRDVIQHLQEHKYVVRDLTGPAATPGNLDSYACRMTRTTFSTSVATAAKLTDITVSKSLRIGMVPRIALSLTRWWPSAQYSQIETKSP